MARISSSIGTNPDQLRANRLRTNSARWRRCVFSAGRTVASSASPADRTRERNRTAREPDKFGWPGDARPAPWYERLQYLHAAPVRGNSGALPSDGSMKKLSKPSGRL